MYINIKINNVIINDFKGTKILIPYYIILNYVAIALLRILSILYLKILFNITEAVFLNFKYC